MIISAVAQSFNTNINKVQGNNTTKPASVKPIVQKNFTRLVDTGYGASLVSFKGLSKSVSSDLSDKVSVAYSALRNDDILLVGTDIGSAKKAFKESIDSFKNVVQNVFFVGSTSLAGALAIRKNDEGFDEIYNLSDKSLFVNHLEKNPFRSEFYESPERLQQNGSSSQLYFLKKDEGPGLLMDFDYISYKMPDNGFVLDKNPKKSILDFADDEILKFDMPSIKDINLKNIENIKVSDVKKDANVLLLKDVGGQDKAVAELKQKVLYPIKYPNFFDKNLSGMHSALLVGPPGTGKTLTAMALANEAGIPFFNMNGQLLEGMYVGESAHNIDEYYEDVMKSQPCILFFDEADAIFSKRLGQHKYADDSVNMHLDKISELEKRNAKVFLLAATNNPERMDDAALRNGRFGTKIEFKAPDTVDKCKDILDIHTKGLNMENIDKNEFSKKLLAAKFNGADIAALVLEAKSFAIERLGIFEQMDNGSFIDTPDYKLVVIADDFEKALVRMKENKKTVADYSKEVVIKGFNQED